MMNRFLILLVILISVFVNLVCAQGFNVDATGMQTFHFKDDMGRNQATFLSKAWLENITGFSSDIWGEVSFDVHDVENTLQGEISISTSSLKSGIDRRNEDLHGANWLDADSYPVITFKIKEVTSIQEFENDKIRIYLLAEFTLHGFTKLVESEATMTYLDESKLTQKRAPGDLLSVEVTFKFKLSDFRIRHMLIGSHVANEIEINANVVGSNYKQIIKNTAN
jgi:polyisoprenoid-binding protein YceI